MEWLNKARKALEGTVTSAASAASTAAASVAGRIRGQPHHTNTQVMSEEFELNLPDENGVIVLYNNNSNSGTHSVTGNSGNGNSVTQHNSGNGNSVTRRKSVTGNSVTGNSVTGNSGNGRELPVVLQYRNSTPTKRVLHVPSGPFNVSNHTTYTHLLYMLFKKYDMAITNMNNNNVKLEKLQRFKKICDTIKSWLATKYKEYETKFNKQFAKFKLNKNQKDAIKAEKLRRQIILLKNAIKNFNDIIAYYKLLVRKLPSFSKYVTAKAKANANLPSAAVQKHINTIREMQNTDARKIVARIEAGIADINNSPVTEHDITELETLNPENPLGLQLTAAEEAELAELAALNTENHLGPPLTAEQEAELKATFGTTTGNGKGTRKGNGKGKK